MLFGRPVCYSHSSMPILKCFSWPEKAITRLVSTRWMNVIPSSQKVWGKPKPKSKPLKKRKKENSSKSLLNVIFSTNRHTGQQSKGACLVPKRALRVMEGEANRVLQLTANAVVPVSYIVPRKVLIIVICLVYLRINEPAISHSLIENSTLTCFLKQLDRKHPSMLVNGWQELMPPSRKFFWILAVGRGKIFT